MTASLRECHSLLKRLRRLVYPDLREYARLSLDNLERNFGRGRPQERLVRTEPVRCPLHPAEVMFDGKILHEQEIDWGKARETIRRGIRYRLGVAESPDLEDLTQESVIRLLRTVRREGAKNTGSLIAVIVGRVVAQYLRYQTRRRLRFSPLGSETAEARDADPRHAPDYLGDPVERLELLVIEIFHRHRSSCIELARFYFLSRDWKSVAEEMGIPHDAVRARWKRCVELLRTVIRGDSSEGLLSRWAEG